MGQFRLEFRCVDDGGVRALVIAVAPIPGVPGGEGGWVMAALAYEDGRIVQKPIKTVDFNKAERNYVVLVEDKGKSVRGPAMLYGPNGGKVL